MMIKATELLESNATPTVEEIKQAFTTSGPSAHLCRCGSYTAIIEAVQRASTMMAKARKAMAISNERSVDVFGATLTRRAFVKAGGALFVGISVAGAGILTKGAQA